MTAVVNNIAQVSLKHTKVSRTHFQCTECLHGWEFRAVKHFSKNLKGSRHEKCVLEQHEIKIEINIRHTSKSPCTWNSLKSPTGQVRYQAKAKVV